MSRKESTFIGMVVALLVITLVSGFMLGFINDLTIEPKAKAKLERKINAIKLVLPDFENNPLEDVQRVKPEKYDDSIEIYPAFKDNKFVGAAVTGYSEKGYSGLVKLMIGFQNDGRIKNIVVLEQKETPGLGTKMKSESFLDQFREKHPDNYKLQVTKDGGDVDAITGATISTRAFNESTQMAYDEFMNYRNAIYASKN